MNHIHAKELYELSKEKPVTIIDIREVYEHKSGHVPHCLNIPMYDLVFQHKVLLNKEAAYYLICQSGHRSEIITDYLGSLGYNVINVSGGHNEWPGHLE